MNWKQLVLWLIFDPNQHGVNHGTNLVTVIFETLKCKMKFWYKDLKGKRKMWFLRLKLILFPRQHQKKKISGHKSGLTPLSTLLYLFFFISCIVLTLQYLYCFFQFVFVLFMFYVHVLFRQLLYKIVNL